MYVNRGIWYSPLMLYVQLIRIKYKYSNILVLENCMYLYILVYCRVHSTNYKSFILTLTLIIIRGSSQKYRDWFGVNYIRIKLNCFNKYF